MAVQRGASRAAGGVRGALRCGALGGVGGPARGDPVGGALKRLLGAVAGAGLHGAPLGSAGQRPWLSMSTGCSSSSLSGRRSVAHLSRVG